MPQRKALTRPATPEPSRSGRQPKPPSKRPAPQAAKADAINRFLIDKLLGQAEPENNPKRTQLTLLEALDRAAAEVGTSFAGQPEIEAAIRMAIGKAYHGWGNMPRARRTTGRPTRF